MDNNVFSFSISAVLGHSESESKELALEHIAHHSELVT